MGNVYTYFSQLNYPVVISSDIISYVRVCVHVHMYILYAHAMLIHTHILFTIAIIVEEKKRS